jgi:hypothetical protein
LQNKFADVKICRTFDSSKHNDMTTANFYLELSAAIESATGISFKSGYAYTNDVCIRLKDHDANWAYFTSDEWADECDYKAIVNINFTGKGCKNETRMTREQFDKFFPSVKVVDVWFDFEVMDVEDACELCVKHIKSTL